MEKAKSKRELGGKSSSSFVDGSQSQGSSSSSTKKAKQPDPFVPADAERLKLIRLLPPPAQPNRSASLTIQREMRTMIKVQEEKGPTEAGFYFDPVRSALFPSKARADRHSYRLQERSGDNLFTWVVELIGFDPDLPLMK